MGFKEQKGSGLETQSPDISRWVLSSVTIKTPPPPVSSTGWSHQSQPLPSHHTLCIEPIRKGCQMPQDRAIQMSNVGPRFAVCPRFCLSLSVVSRCHQNTGMAMPRPETVHVSLWGLRMRYKPDQKGREGSGAPMSETNAVIPSLLSEYLGTSGEPQEKGVKNWGSKIFLSPRDNLCARWRGGGRAYDERNLV